MERKVEVAAGLHGVVSLGQPLLRYDANPILTSHQVNEVWSEPHRQVVTVHNAGVAVAGGATVMLFRSHLRSGVSVIGRARSDDGVTGWRVEPRPALLPAAAGLEPEEIVRMETGGV